MKRLVTLLLVVGCGSDNPNPGQADAAVDSASSADAAIDAPAGPLTLTSPMLTEGAAIAAANTCDGANTSPQLAWTGDAMGATSYAIVFTDTTNMLVHWIIYDIPGTATGLPADVEKAYAPANVPGAHQTTSYQTTVRGYLGPCPPAGDGPHTYQFVVYGLNVATIPGTSMTTSRSQALNLIAQYQIVHATLSGTYERN